MNNKYCFDNDGYFYAFLGGRGEREHETLYPSEFYLHSSITLKPYYLILSVVRQHNSYDHFGKCWSCQSPRGGEMPHRSYVKIRKLSAAFIFHGEDSDGEYFSTQTRSLSTVSCPYWLVSYPVSITRLCKLLRIKEISLSLKVFTADLPFKKQTQEFMRC